MCTRPIYITPKRVSDVQRYAMGWQSFKGCLVPCGKCTECIQQRQNDITARIYNEARDMPCMYFVTLTYAPEHEPWSISFWQISRETGEYSRLTCPEIVELPYWLERARSLNSLNDYHRRHSRTRVLEVPVCNSDSELRHYFVSNSHATIACALPLEALAEPGSDIVARLTPSCDLKDPRLALKNWRVGYQRKYKRPLPRFKYALVGEYGHFFTKRPHYHLIFMGKDLTEWQVKNFCMKYWKYGNYDLRVVYHTNKDGSDAFSLVSKYLGKYISKGPFEHDAVKAKMALKCRFCSSKFLGLNLSQQTIDTYTCQDVYRFEQNDALNLPEDVKRVIIPEIARRLRFKIVVKKKDGSTRSLEFALPHSLKKQVFQYHVSKSDGVGAFSPLWYMVADYIQRQHASNDYREFLALCSQERFRGCICEAVAEYENCKALDLQNREETARAYLLNFYQNNSKI